MLENDRTDVYKGIDINKASFLRERIVCEYFVFKIPNINHVNAMVVILQKSFRLDAAEVCTIEKKDHRAHYWNISKAEAMSRMKKTDLTEKNRTMEMKKSNYF